MVSGGVTYYEKFMNLSIVLNIVLGEIFFENYFKAFSFLLIWDKNLRFHIGWLVAKPFGYTPNHSPDLLSF